VRRAAKRKTLFIIRRKIRANQREGLIRYCDAFSFTPACSPTTWGIALGQIIRLPVTVTENDPLIDARLRNGTLPFNRRVYHRGIDGGTSGRSRRRRTSL
jgi:hypothetical protein